MVGCEIIVLYDKIKHKGEGVHARDIKHSFLAVGVVLNAHSSFFLHPDAQNQMRSDLRRKRAREEEKKKDSSSLLGDLVQIPSDLHEEVRAAFIFFKCRKRIQI